MTPDGKCRCACHTGQAFHRQPCSCTQMNMRETPFVGNQDIDEAAEGYGKSVMGSSPEPDRPKP